MAPLRIGINLKAEDPQRADFAVEINDDQLLVSPDVAAAARQLGVRNAVELISMVQDFPTALAHGLGWSVDEVVAAGQKLFDELRDRDLVESELLAAQVAPPRQFGARNPFE